MKTSLACFCILFSVFLHAAPSLEDYGNLPEVDQIAVSPDGNLIAFRRVNSEIDNVYIYSLKEGKHIAGLDVSRVKPRFMYFLNNENLFLYASEHRRIAGFRGKHEVSTGYLLEAKTGEVKQLLIPGDGTVYPGQSGLGRVVGVSPDGKYVYMPAYYGDANFIGGQSLRPSFTLLRVNLKGRSKPKLHKSGSKNAIDFFVNKQGELLAIEEFDDEKDLHTLVAIHGKDKREIFREETGYITRGFVGVTPDEKHIVMVDENPQTGRDAYYLISLEDGSINGPAHDREDADITGVIDDIQRVVHGVVYSGFTPGYKFFDSTLNERVKNIQAKFAEHRVAIASHSPDWKHIVILVEGSQAAGDYYLFSEGKKPVYITSQRPNITDEDVNPLGTVIFTASDGLKIPTIVTIPRDKLSDMKNLPAVVMPHGGPAAYDQLDFDYLAQALASQGYMIIKPQFRGSSGFGAEHERAGAGEWGRKMQSDVSEAVQFFVGKGMVDPKRVCIVGGSYGGYAALAGGAFTPELYKCIVSINGISDLHSFRAWISREAGRSSGALAYWDRQIGGEAYSKDIARERSPAEFAEKFQAPVLLIHGKDDEVVDIRQSEIMEKALKKAKKDVTFVELKGDDHWLSLGTTRLQTLKATVEFINKNI